MNPSFSIDRLESRLRHFPAVQTYLVGFSGGCDSTALLQAMHRLSPDLGARVAAIHFNHGLNPAATAWEMHCRQFCEKRGIALEVEALILDSDDAGIESRARTLRYAAIERRIDNQTLYLTAHNLDDRVETFLLHALRGSGVDGLASIPEIRPLGDGHVARPFLDVTRATLERYLAEQGIDWIEDPTNKDSGFDRNFIRNEVIPMLESRWPAAKTCLARSSRHLRTASTTLESLLTGALEPLVLASETLATKVLFHHGQSAAPLVLRAWLRGRGAPSLPMARLESFLAQVESAAPGARCETTWSGWTLRVFRGEVHLLPPGDISPCPKLAWTGQSVDLGPGLGTLALIGPETRPPSQWLVGPRQPGARIRLHAGGPARKLKKVMQELPIPPWQRPSIPVLYWEEEAAAVGDWIFSPRLAEWLAGSQLDLRWFPKDPSFVATRQLCHEYIRSLDA